MQVEIASSSSLDEDKWNELLEKSPQSTVYHTKSWAEVWEKSFPGSNSFFIVCTDEKGDYLAGIPIWQREKFGLKSLYSMPFDTYGGIIKRIKADDQIVFPVYEKLKEIIEKERVIQAQVVDFFSIQHHLCNLGFRSRRIYSHMLSLDRIDENDYLASFNQKRREKIRQSQRRGGKAEDIRSLEDVRECYKLLMDTYRRHKVKPLKYTLRFFENIFSIMGKRNLLKWVIVLKDEKLIASLINFAFKDTVYAWKGASASRELDLRPNDLKYLFSILWAKKNGFKFFNFGTTPEFAEGMIKFKESWGAQRYEYLIHDKKKGLGKLLDRIRNISRKK